MVGWGGDAAALYQGLSTRLPRCFGIGRPRVCVGCGASLVWGRIVPLQGQRHGNSRSGGKRHRARAPVCFPRGRGQFGGCRGATVREDVVGNVDFDGCHRWCPPILRLRCADCRQLHDRTVRVIDTSGGGRSSRPANDLPPADAPATGRATVTCRRSHRTPPLCVRQRSVGGAPPSCGSAGSASGRLVDPRCTPRR